MTPLVRGMLLAATLAFAGPVDAQLFRAYLASDGNDANPCTLPQPCRLLPAALNAVANGGQIWMLDSANYNAGPVTVAKSVSIRAVPGSVGSLVVLGGSAISIAAAGLDVALRNIALGPIATSPPAGFQFGLWITGDSTVTLDGCIVEDLPTEGIRIQAGRLKVVDSVFRGNATAVNVLTSGSASITGSRFIGNTYGVIVYGYSSPGTAQASVTDSVISGTGFSSGARVALAASAAIARLAVSRTLIDGHFYAVQTFNGPGLPGTGTVSVSGSTIAGNTYAFHQEGVGTGIYTLGNNHVVDYLNADVCTVSPLAPQ